MNKENFPQDPKFYEDTTEILKALAHPVRLCIVRGLAQSDGTINEIKRFIEGLPILVFDSELMLDFLNDDFKNILSIKELSALLEPYLSEYSTSILINMLTNIDINKNILDDVTKLIMILNALLCRQWQREENKTTKKKKSLYKILMQDYNINDKWGWVKYLQKPLFFVDTEYSYVIYENSNIKKEYSDFKINYNLFEELLKDRSIWDRDGDFGYEYRESQLNLCKTIRENIESESKIFIEAPTGSGKTFSYVLISVLEIYKNIKLNKRDNTSFIISTDTKELQNQLIEKDIPSIISKLNLTKDIKFGYLKGKSNYICVDKLIKTTEFKNDIKGMLAEIFLKRLCSTGEYGDIEKISIWAYNHFELNKYINHVVCNKDECNLDKCTRTCLLKKRYNEISDENITVINHSLLANWPYNERKKITHLIIDEAHNFMEKSYELFSNEFVSNECINFIEQIYEKEPTIFRELTNLNATLGYRETIELDKLKYWVNEIKLSIQLIINECINSKLIKNEYSFKIEFYLDNEYKHISSILNVYFSKLKENIYGLYSIINKYFSNITLDSDEGEDYSEYKILSNYINKLKELFNSIDNFLEDPKDKKDYARIF